MSTEATPAASGDLLLKVTPPRVPRHLIARASLAWKHPRFSDSPVILVQAPAGFGKTSLLAQWRRECLAEGAAVAWVSAQSQDDMGRFVQGLALAVRVGAGRPTFGHVLLQAAPRDGLEATTLWLAELAQSALNVVLFVDEAERLPADAREALTYVLRNAPPNLRCVVAARPDSPLDLGDLVAYGQCTIVAAEHLRFGLEETTALVRSRMGEGFDRDGAARLHEMTEGWPLGLQLTLAVMDGGARELPRLDLHGGALREHFVGHLLANLAPPDLEFLTSVAVAAPLHPQLCAALLASDEAPTQLARLQRDTPVFVAGEQTEWVRMHSLVRGAMLRRFEALPAARKAELHARAADWLAGRGMLEAAARHALASGQPKLAYDMAERSLYEALMSQGRQGAVLEWLGWLPAEELDARPRLLLAATWSLALSEHHEEAQRYVSRILARPDVDDSLRCECAMILGGAAIFADDPDRFAELHDPWAEAPPLKDPKLLHVHANRTAFRALLAGEPALARLRQLQAPREAGTGSVYLQRWGDFHVAHTYLWEGQVLLAEKLLRPALAAADADLGRRSSFAAMLATLLAAALWERDLPEEAEAALANRLDVVERSATADSVMLAYRTLIRIAISHNDESRAQELLGALEAVGIARRLPRLRIASHLEAVRMHARRFRAETCRPLCRQIDELLAGPDAHAGPLWQQSVRLLQATAQSYAAIAAQDWRGALEALARADDLAQQARLGRLHIELLGLRAFALDRCGEKSRPLLGEALDLAQSCGLVRVFEDAHPALGAWVRDVAGDGARPKVAAPAPAEAAAREPARLRATPSLVLTPKEREVLELLARNLSNKEIGLAMQVGEETIKWHMKNLFAKLDAGTRKQVVSRARILGLLADAG